MIRRWHLAVLAVLAVLALACEGGGVAGRPTPTATTGKVKGYPSSMAALGDSISAGFASCGSVVLCRRNSWSTGTSAEVDSHYRRILAKNPRIAGHTGAFAQPGAEADALAGQAARAVDMKAQYVTILIGANDACARTADRMTPVATFRAEIDRGLAVLRKGLPSARVLVASIPDVYRLWQLGRADEHAVRAWNTFRVCQSMLAAPTSAAPADDQRRRAVRDRIDDYDDQLRQACRAYGRRCRWDGGRVHDLRFTLALVNHGDYFHPGAEGQRRLADATYPGRFTW
jgi:lysophospholipase L1-like esterase